MIKSGRKKRWLNLVTQVNSTVKMNTVFHTEPLDLIVRTEKMSDATGENERDEWLGHRGGEIGAIKGL